MGRIELLSPAGNLKSLKYAIQNGADAIYLGLKAYSARMSAQNFDAKQLEEGIEYSHLRGKKVYAAINTLLNEEELYKALSLAQKLEEMKIDALIVQDLGFACMLRDRFSIPLHASTQMTIYNTEGVKKLKDIGFNRVILSRELSIKEIEDIVKEDIMEIEVFCHGSLCISYSGQCLLSSALGNRSGNKGDCAMPCRLRYSLLKNQIKADDYAYRISPNDLASLPYLDKLIASGIKSLKIEGRLKSPEYSGLVTSKYRKAIDSIEKNEAHYTDKDLDDLRISFSRGKFTSYHLIEKMPISGITYTTSGRLGLDVGNLKSIEKYKKASGPDIFDLKADLYKPLKKGDGIRISTSEDGGSINTIKEEDGSFTINIAGALADKHEEGSLIYKTYDEEVNLSLKRMMEKENIKIPLSMQIEVLHNKPIKLTVNGIGVFSTSLVEKAKNRPIGKDDIVRQLSKLGDTIYYIDKLDIKLDDQVFVPMSELADIRRRAIEAIKKEAIE